VPTPSDHLQILTICKQKQDILFAFNLRSCKVPPYAMRYVMQCSCGDEPHFIPRNQRRHALDAGGLWCVGTLSMQLADGTSGIIYNPYTLEILSRGVSGITSYIQCLSENPLAYDGTSCPPPQGIDQLLPILVQQKVEPIAVWARCKSNYAQSAWDVGAGALFSYSVGTFNDANPRLPAAVTPAIRDAAVAWANSVSPELLACLRDKGRIQLDFGVCLTLYHSVVHAATPSRYFLYEAASSSSISAEPPDACLVFSGLRNSSTNGSPLRRIMEACADEQKGVLTPQHCDLNPLGWSSAQPQKIAAASVHGVVPPPPSKDAMDSDKGYAAPLAILRAAYAMFNRTYQTDTKNDGDEASKIDAALFSADGDFIHDFFDCMFLGPYSRVVKIKTKQANIL
jgi:hypothetical protein